MMRPIGQQVQQKMLSATVQQEISEKWRRSTYADIKPIQAAEEISTIFMLSPERCVNTELCDS